VTLCNVQSLRCKTWGIALVFLCLSSLTHFYHLDHPEYVVFDEVHFGSYVDAYCCSGARFFDIHPPHTKLITAATAKLLGYEGGQNFKTINTYFPGSDAIALRFISALSGTLLTVVLFFLVVQLGGSLTAAAFAAGIILLDNALLVQTRLIALDGSLLLGIFASLLCVILAGRQQHKLPGLLLFILGGLFAGLATGSKFTGLVSFALAFIAAVQAFAASPGIQTFKKWSLGAIVFSLSFSLYYLGGWVLHFELLNAPGPGDIWQVWQGPSFWSKLIHMHETMLSANANLTATHPDASMWWGWPWMHSPLYYWVNDNKVVYLMGNPLIWWTFSILFISFLVISLLLKTSALHINQQHPLVNNNTLLPLLGYIMAYAPLVAVSRALFLYHYFTAFIFSILFVVLWLEKIGWLNPYALFKQRLSVYLAVLFMIGGFFFILPLSYALVDSMQTANWIFEIFPGWR